MTNVTSIRIADDLVSHLDGLAKQMNRTKSWVINEALREYVSKDELKRKRWQETEEALAAIEDGDEYEEQDVHAWLDSWGSENELPAPNKS